MLCVKSRMPIRRLCSGETRSNCPADSYSRCESRSLDTIVRNLLARFRSHEVITCSSLRAYTISSGFRLSLSKARSSVFLKASPKSIYEVPYSLPMSFRVNHSFLAVPRFPSEAEL